MKRIVPVLCLCLGVAIGTSCSEMIFSAGQAQGYSLSLGDPGYFEYSELLNRVRYLEEQTGFCSQLLLMPTPNSLAGRVEKLENQLDTSDSPVAVNLTLRACEKRLTAIEETLWGQGAGDKGTFGQVGSLERRMIAVEFKIGLRDE